MSLVPARDWEPPIVETRAHEGAGIGELWAAVERHRAHLVDAGVLEQRRRDGLRRQLRALALDRLGRRLDEACDAAFTDKLVDRVLSRDVDPDTAVDEILRRLP
jgi:LAO/AO transport system kinase